MSDWECAGAVRPREQRGGLVVERKRTFIALHGQAVSDRNNRGSAGTGC
jgi:hypothetical protein